MAMMTRMLVLLLLLTLAPGAARRVHAWSVRTDDYSGLTTEAMQQAIDRDNEAAGAEQQRVAQERAVARKAYEAGNARLLRDGAERRLKDIRAVARTRKHVAGRFEDAEANALLVLALVLFAGACGYVLVRRRRHWRDQHRLAALTVMHAQGTAQAPRRAEPVHKDHHAGAHMVKPSAEMQQTLTRIRPLRPKKD